jgi:hypothetical protein
VLEPSTEMMLLGEADCPPPQATSVTASISAGGNASPGSVARAGRCRHPRPGTRGVFMDGPFMSLKLSKGNFAPVSGV